MKVSTWIAILLFSMAGTAASQPSGAAPPNPAGVQAPGGPPGLVVPTVLLDAPASIQAGETSQMTATISAPQRLPATRVVVDAPKGWTVEPKTFDFPAGAVTYSRLVKMSCPNSEMAGDRRFSITATSIGEALAPATAVVKVKVVRSIAVSPYLLIGIAGVALGYGLRLLIYVLKSTPAPAPAPVPPGANDGGRLTQFVRGHYYAVDFAVTLVIGLLILIGLINDGKPPTSAAAWYGALTAGATLGLLTNSELITRVR